MTKKIIITGTSKGIGKATASLLLDEGHLVVGICRTSTINHPNYTHIPLDLSQTKDLEKKLKTIAKEHHDADALVCNAGIGLVGNLEELSSKSIENLMNINFFSAVYLTKAFLPYFKKKKEGDIVFIGSKAALFGTGKLSIYCASKFAIRGFALSLRDECSSSNIRVCIINPGVVNTPFFEHLPIKASADQREHIDPLDIAYLIHTFFTSRKGTVIEEINLSPQVKNLIRKESYKN